MRGRVSPAERTALADWLTPAQLDVFDAMPAPDRRHGLDVVACLRSPGATDQELLVAGLLHDCGKGPGIRLVHRVAWSLGENYGAWIWRGAGVLPTFERALGQLRDHAERSARLAERSGCSPRTVELIRHQDEPVDEAGRLLHEADEAN
ncbi:MAG TPA: hypothetical protein VIK06_07855 [Candidatus Limnocylindrales bacterium]